MAINFARQVYQPTFDVFARPVTFTPVASQPGQPDYTARGIYASQPYDIDTEGNVIFSDARTILDIIETEFTILPLQKDRIYIGPSGDLPEIGYFEVLDTDSNGGGETTLTLKRIVSAKP